MAHSRRYWLTTHWPPLVGDPPDHAGLWVPHDRRDVIENARPGDLALIYESMSGKSVVRRQADGTEMVVRRVSGAGGLVAIHEVTDAPFEPDESEPEQYDDGSETWWRWQARTRALSTSGFVPMRELAILLGYKPNYNFHGFGTRHSGLKEIDEAEFNSIIAAFRESGRGEFDRSVRSARGPRGGGKGEGPEHLALKLAIAENPSLLGEEGLRLVKIEFPFPTGDKIDVVLEDYLGRIVTIEVEVDCPEEEVAGPLQTMKYRALAAYWFDREVDEVRSILVAHSIHPTLVDRLNRYGVECVEISRATLAGHAS